MVEAPIQTWSGMPEPGDGLEVERQIINDREVLGVHMHLSMPPEAAEHVLKILAWVVDRVAVQVAPGVIGPECIESLARGRERLDSDCDGDAVQALDRFRCADDSWDDPPATRLSGRIAEALRYIEELEEEGRHHVALLDEAHAALDAAGVDAKGTPGARIGALLGRTSPLHEGRVVDVHLMGHRVWYGVQLVPCPDIAGAISARSQDGAWIGTFGPGALHSVVPSAFGAVEDEEVDEDDDPVPPSVEGDHLAILEPATGACVVCRRCDWRGTDEQLVGGAANCPSCGSTWEVDEAPSQGAALALVDGSDDV